MIYVFEFVFVGFSCLVGYIYIYIYSLLLFFFDLSQLSLFKAFKLLHESNVTAVAVIDDEGKLMGNISASDLRVVSLTSNIMDH